jgi:hypothetical protein
VPLGNDAREPRLPVFCGPGVARRIGFEDLDAGIGPLIELDSFAGSR